MKTMTSLVDGKMHCEAFTIWGWLHQVEMNCYIDPSTNHRWPRSHVMCLLTQRWPRLHAMCPFSPPQENSRCFAVCNDGKLAPLSEPLHAAVRHEHVRGLSFSLSLFSSVSLSSLSCMIVLLFLLSRSLALSCLSCPSTISSSLSMPPLCSGQVGHPRLQDPGVLLRSRQGRNQVCDESL